MRKLDLEKVLFCLVDVQERLFPHMQNRATLQKNLTTLIEGLKLHEVPFVINEQYKKGIGETIQPLKELVEEYPHFEKTTFSCCQNQESLAAIKAANKKQIIVAGIETHVCVLQTCLDLLEEGFEVILVTDCCSSRKQTDKEVAIARLIQAGATPATYEMILFELTVNSKHPKFKEISALVK